MGITFKTNPGILKSIEIDTRAVNNPGRPDYWVANARQGQFASRYTKNLGRIQVLQYGSKHLYTNNDLTTAANGGVAQHTLVKVGGQEFRVHEAKTNKLILDEPYLGASIQPVTVDTGVTAKTGAGTFLKAASTAAIASSLGVGAAIYINDCAMTVNAYANALGSDTVATAADQTIITGTYAAGPPRNVGVEAATDGGNDCALSFLSTGTQPIYRRSDDTANQNLYKTTGDQAAAAASGMGVSFQRGSATGDITTSNEDTGVLNAIDLIAEVTTAGSETTTVTELQATGSVAANDKFYFHTHGPFAVDDVSTTKELVFNGVDAQQTIIGLFGAPTTAAHIHMTTSAGASDGALDATKALLIGGRRYRVKSTSGTSVTLSETFAGGQLRQLCAACVTAQDSTSLELSVNEALDDIAQGALVGIGLNLNLDNFAMVKEAVAEHATAQKVKPGKSANREGTNFFISGSAEGTFDGSVGKPANQDLYMIQGFSDVGYSYSTITEDAAGSTYQYVAQCSNRGSCDASTGLCKCFKGYSNDNCDTQNMLAA